MNSANSASATFYGFHFVANHSGLTKEDVLTCPDIYRVANHTVERSDISDAYREKRGFSEIQEDEESETNSAADADVDAGADTDAVFDSSGDDFLATSLSEQGKSIIPGLKVYAVPNEENMEKLAHDLLNGTAEVDTSSIDEASANSLLKNFADLCQLSTLPAILKICLTFSNVYANCDNWKLLLPAIFDCIDFKKTTMIAEVLIGHRLSALELKKRVLQNTFVQVDDLKDVQSVFDCIFLADSKGQFLEQNSLTEEGLKQLLKGLASGNASLNYPFLRYFKILQKIRHHVLTMKK